MENGKTRLQKIVEQKTEQIKNALLEAIAAGAEIKTGFAGATIDGVFFVTNTGLDQKEVALCLRFRSDEFEEIIKPTSELDEEAEQLRERLKEIEEIKERRAKK